MSAITIPSFLDMPSASSALKALRTTREKATSFFNTVAGVSSTAFLLAFAMSPRGFRHPYLLYTSLLVFGTRLTSYVTPTLFPEPSREPSAAAQRRAAAHAARRDRLAARPMEASYEDLGSETANDLAAGVDAEVAALDEEVNGEEVRTEVTLFKRNQLVQGAVASVGFIVAVIGIWGDGAYTRASETLIIGLA